MNSVSSARLADGAETWCVDPSFERVGAWLNKSRGRRDVQIEILALAASAEDEDCLRKAEQVIPLSIRPAVFVFDPGAQVSIVSGSLALDLGLNLSDQPVDIVQVRGSLPVLKSKFLLSAGKEWIELECWVPYPATRADRTENLLGMKGLLDRHLFCFDRDELHLFRRRTPRPAL